MAQRVKEEEHRLRREKKEEHRLRSDTSGGDLDDFDRLVFGGTSQLGGVRGVRVAMRYLGPGSWAPGPSVLCEQTHKPLDCATNDACRNMTNSHRVCVCVCVCV